MENKPFLKELRIRNVRGISQASLAFHGSFTVLSGESGAGKSSVVRAIELLCGKRGGKGLILEGQEELYVEALFNSVYLDFWKSRQNENLLSFCISPDTEEDDAFFLSRQGKKNGRSQGYVSLKPIPLSALGEAGNALLSIQSQHAHLDLLHKDRQMNFLDIYGGAELLDSKKNLQDSIKKSISLEKLVRDLATRRDHFQKSLAPYEDLAERGERFHFGPRSEGEWNKELEALAQEEVLSGQLLSLKGCFQSSHDAPEDLLSTVERTLQETPSQMEDLLGKERAEEYKTLLDNTLEAGRNLESFVLSLSSEIREDHGSSVMDLLDRKLEFLKELKQLFPATSGEDLYLAYEDMQKQLQWYYNSEKEMRDFLERRKEVHRITKQVAKELRQKRQQASQKLERTVDEALKDLGMGNTRFSVVFEPKNTVSKNGAEEVLFSIARGENPFSSIKDIASGGELSRILLALHVASPEGVLPPVLVFDEVEAGLGGESALCAGKLLQRISRSFQVLLVTHEASIAAMAGQHILVQRQGEETTFKDLSFQGRVEELARMLSGDSHNPKALDHARALLQEHGHAPSEASQ